MVSPTAAELAAIKTGYAALTVSKSPTSYIVEQVVYALGAAQMLMDPEIAEELRNLRAESKPATLEQHAVIAVMLADAKPVRDNLLVQIAESVRDMREHDHGTQREDWYCLNLAAFMGERMGPVLRRLLNAEAEVERLRAELTERSQVLVDADAERERLTARVAELETELAPARADRANQRDDLAHALGRSIDTEWSDLISIAAAAVHAEAQLAMEPRATDGAVAALADAVQAAQGDEWVRCSGLRCPNAERCTKAPERGWVHGHMDTWLCPKCAVSAAEHTPAGLTVYRAAYEDEAIPLGTYTTRQAAREHAEDLIRREYPEHTQLHFRWADEDYEDDPAEALHATVERGDENRTGYVVTPLQVASAYDAEAEE